MKMKKLGNSDLLISEIGLGCMGMSGTYGEANDDESLKVIDRALELGVNFFDTANVYGRGHNEKLLGRAMKNRRDKFVIGTKFGFPMGPNESGVNGRPDYVKKCCEDSLQRLGIDTIDLYYQHRVDRTVPIEETVGALSELIKEGKIRYYGLSEASTETLRKANAVHPVSALQSEYSLWARDAENEALSVCKELGITFVAFSPVGRGFLTGTVKNDNFASNDFRNNSPRFHGDHLEKNLELVRFVEILAEEKGCTPAQLALAWVLAKDENVEPIPGTKRIKYLEENIAATEINLNKAEVEKLSEKFKPENISGARYKEELMKTLNG
jgi:aryl-alcohol dehydrogenase-like predicted oxidoreductase